MKLWHVPAFVPPSEAMTLAVICVIQMVARLPFGAGSGQWKNQKL